MNTNTMPQRGLELSHPSISFVQLAESKFAVLAEDVKAVKAVMIMDCLHPGD
jgi:hypothetical protein